MNRLFILSCAALALACLAGCAALSGKHSSFAVYSPQPSMPAPSAQQEARPWQLLIDLPQASAALDTTRIAVMPAPGVLQVYADARWSDPAPALLRSLIVRAFGSDGRVSGVSATDTGLRGDFSLAIELHDFQMEVTDGSPQAAIRLSAKLYQRSSNRIVASRSFSAQAVAPDTGVASLLPAFEGALADLLRELVDWTIAQGDARESGMADGES